MKITVLGAGAWGTALAISLAAKNQVVIMWGRNQAAMDGHAQIARENRHYLAGFPSTWQIYKRVPISI